jgi:pyridoxamine 5'-phosphate oxidase
MDRTDLSSIRSDYALKELTEDSVSHDPFAQFEQWMDEALTSQVHEPTAMTVSTVGADGQPASRTVLLKGYSPAGFIFFTNYESKKAGDIEHEPRVALHLFWRELERQVEITGVAEKTSRGESEAYFATRPRASQIGAWASKQSSILASRSELEERVAKLEAEYDGREREIPCPPNWGGYRVRPLSVEFWQGRRSRLHDRLRYQQNGGMWEIVRLSP